MSLNESQIDAIEVAIKALLAIGNPLLPGLRELFPGLIFVRCDIADMDAEPFRFSRKYRLYLLSRNEGCLSIACRLENANGVAIAEME